MFKKFIAQQIVDKVSDIPDSTSIGDASAYAEEIIMAIEEANEALRLKLESSICGSGEGEGTI